MTVADNIAGFLEKSSWIRKMFEEGTRRRKLYGEDNVFDFSIGNPNVPPPQSFYEVLKKIAEENPPGIHGYMSNAGLPETRQAVADYLTNLGNKVFGLEDIIMTVGAGGGLNVVLKTILNPGEEVIIPSPYFVEYNFYLLNHQGVPKTVPVKDDMSLDINAIADAINEKTRAVIINSPNNPTGAVFSKDELSILAGLLENKSSSYGRAIYIVYDEPYRKIVYDNIQLPNITDIYNNSFIVTSFSKDLSLPGERIGYAAVCPAMEAKQQIIAGMVFCNRVLGYVNAPALMQRVVAYLLNETVDVNIYKRKRDLLCNGLKELGYEFNIPKGAFYLFTKTPINDDIEFVKILQDENILTVPGSGFEKSGYMRIAYCVSDKIIERSMGGFERAIKKALN